MISFSLLAENKKLIIPPPKDVIGKTFNLFKDVESNDKIIFYTLDPRRGQRDDFRDWKVLGKKEIKDLKTKELIFTNLYKAMEKNKVWWRVVLNQDMV